MDGNYIKMKIYIPQNKLSLIKESINEEVTFFEFYRDIKKFIKDLLSNPFMLIQVVYYKRKVLVKTN